MHIIQDQEINDFVLHSNLKQFLDKIIKKITRNELLLSLDHSLFKIRGN